MKEKSHPCDKHAVNIEGWLYVERITLDEAVKRLAAMGCVVTRSALHRWKERLEYKRLLGFDGTKLDEKKLLEAYNLVSAGLKQCRELHRQTELNDKSEDVQLDLVDRALETGNITDEQGQKKQDKIERQHERTRKRIEETINTIKRSIDPYIRALDRYGYKDLAAMEARRSLK